MLAIMLLAGAVAAAGILTVPYLSANSTLREIFQEAASRLKIDFDRLWMFKRPYIEGPYENLHVYVETFFDSAFSKFRTTIVRIECSPYEASQLDVSITYGYGMSSFLELSGKKDIEIGNDSFDNRMRIEGNSLDAAVLLNSEVISMINVIKRHSVFFGYTPGQLTVSLRADGISSSDIVLKIKHIVNLYKTINEKKDRRICLIKNIKTERNKQIKLKNIERLIEYYPDLLLKKDLYKVLLKGYSWEIKLKVLRSIGQKAGPEILKIFNNASVEHRLELIDIIKESRLKGLNNMLIEYYSITDYDHVKLKIIQTCSELKDYAFSQFLCGVLSENEKDLKIEIIRSLAVCGTIKAVEPLYNVNKSSFGVVKSESKKAIESIQRRLGAEHAEGMLSIQNNTEQQGNLSITSDNKGSLSFDDD